MMRPGSETSAESIVTRSVARLGRLVAAAMALSRLPMTGGHGETVKDPPAGRVRDLIPGPLLDQLLAGVDPQTVFRPNGLLDELRKALVERVLIAEMERQLAAQAAGNSRIRSVAGRATAEAGSPQSPRC